MLKRLFTAELRVWHLPVVLALVSSGTGGALAGQQPTTASTSTVAAPDGFFPSGAFNMAGAAKNDDFTVTNTSGELEAIRQSFTIPAGQKADIAAFFNSEAYKYATGYCYLKFYIDAIAPPAMRPGQLWVADGYIYSNAYPTISAQAFRPDVPSGTHTVIVTLSTNGGNCYLNDRSLIILSNRHQ